MLSAPAHEIETAEESNYVYWNERIGILDFMLSNLEYYDSKELGDYDDICDLIEKVSGSIHQATRIKKCCIV